MSANNNQLKWSANQNKGFINPPKLLITLYNSNGNGICWLANYDESTPNCYKVIESINANGSCSVIWSKIPNNSVVINLFVIDPIELADIKTQLKTTDRIEIAASYGGVGWALTYYSQYKFVGYKISDDGLHIILYGEDYLLSYLEGKEYNGEINTSSGSATPTAYGIDITGRPTNEIIYNLFDVLSAGNYAYNFFGLSSNGLLLNITKREAFQYVLQAHLSINNGNTIPILDFAYKGNTSSKYSWLITTVRDLIMKLASSQVAYDNNRTDKYIVRPLIEYDYPHIEYEENIRNISVNVYENSVENTSVMNLPTPEGTVANVVSPGTSSNLTHTLTNPSKVSSLSDLSAVCFDAGGTIRNDIFISFISLVGSTLTYRITNTTNQTLIITTYFYSSQPTTVYTNELYNGSFTIGNANTQTEVITLEYNNLTYSVDNLSIQLVYDNSKIDSITNVKYYNNKIVFTATRNINVSYTTPIDFIVRGSKIIQKKQLITETINVDGTQDIEIDNPLITTKGQANNIVAFFNNFFKSPYRTISVNCRIDPAIALYSIIKVYDKNNNEYYVVVTDYQYTFNGGYQGTIKGIIIDPILTGILLQPRLGDQSFITDQQQYDIDIYNDNSVAVSVVFTDENDTVLYTDTIQPNDLANYVTGDFALTQDTPPLLIHFEYNGISSDTITLDS